MIVTTVFIIKNPSSRRVYFELTDCSITPMGITGTETDREIFIPWSNVAYMFEAEVDQSEAPHLDSINT